MVAPTRLGCREKAIAAYREDWVRFPGAIERFMKQRIVIEWDQNHTDPITDDLVRRRAVAIIQGHFRSMAQPPGNIATAYIWSEWETTTTAKTMAEHLDCHPAVAPAAPAPEVDKDCPF